MRPLTVILDNGHGSDTPGKRSPMWPDGRQLFEYEFNRDIAVRVDIGLKKAGIECLRLVPELHDVSISERINCANRIVAAANRDGRQCVLISIHANAGGGTGFEVFTSKGKTRSDDLAEMFYRLAESWYLKQFKMRRDTSDGDSDKEADWIGILRATHCPAVLTENLFMDTWRDCKFLLSEQGRQTISGLHIAAIVAYAQKYAGYKK